MERGNERIRRDGKMSLKFRIWSKEYKMFTSDQRWPNNQHTHEQFLLSPAEEVWCLVTTDNENYFRDISDKYVVQRATGLRDKNDVDIYGGDIVKWGGLNYLVEWNDVSYKWQGRCPYYHSYHHPTTENFRDLMSGVIVGNVFENPELLK